MAVTFSTVTVTVSLKAPLVADTMTSPPLLAVLYDNSPPLTVTVLPVGAPPNGSTG